MGFLAVGRKYGVSDNAVRKWIRWYEYNRELTEATRRGGWSGTAVRARSQGRVNRAVRDRRRNQPGLWQTDRGARPLNHSGQTPEQ